jgi:predicted regulator of Ras-like GTPase activity (Roadblock/LC7/MglB family)
MNILNDFHFLGGVRHVCVIKSGEMQASTFPEFLQANLISAARMMEQMLMGIQPLGQEHNEVYIEMDESQLIGVKIAEDTLFALMTDRNINYSLINTAIRSAKPKLLSLAPVPTLENATSNAATALSPSPANIISEHEKQQVALILSQLQTLLAEMVGPAASVLFRKTMGPWMDAGDAKLSRLQLLVNNISAYIDHPEKRARFIEQCSALIANSSSMELN